MGTYRLTRIDHQIFFCVREPKLLSHSLLSIIPIATSITLSQNHSLSVPETDNFLFCQILKDCRAAGFLNGMFLNGKNPMDPANRNPESRLWTLMARKLAGEASQDELIELEVLVQKTPDAHYVVEIVTLWWQLSEKSGKEQAEQAVADLLSQLEKENEMFRPNKRGRIDNFCLA